jgi:hypothetical protein
MSVNEGLKPLDQNSAAPIDPNVHIPDHVRRSSEAAELLHKSMYTPEPTETPADVQAAAHEAASRSVEGTQNGPQEVQNPVQNPQQNPQNPAPTGDDFTGPADPQALRDSEWARRYNSMQGRWQQAERSRAAMEQQMSELGRELVRTQQMLTEQGRQPSHSHVSSQNDHKKLITEDDVANYGTELIDLARRAAMETVGPEIENLRAENARLTSKVASTSKRELFATLDAKMPTWRQVNTNPQFVNWLRLRNIYTGQIRQEMLNNAVNGAQAPVVLQMFRDFLTEAQATGQMPQNQPIEQHAVQQQAPHNPAVDLATLAAPGRARPAQGDTNVPADKPSYSHAQIAANYSEKRRGLWANRLGEWDKLEADMIAAGREGRVR